MSQAPWALTRHRMGSARCRDSLAGVRSVWRHQGLLPASDSLSPKAHQPSRTDWATATSGSSGDQEGVPLTTARCSRFPLRLRISQAASLESLARDAPGGEGRWGLEGRVKP